MYCKNYLFNFKGENFRNRNYCSQNCSLNQINSVRNKQNQRSLTSNICERQIDSNDFYSSANDHQMPVMVET